MADTLPKLLQEIHSIRTASELQSQLTTLRSRIETLKTDETSTIYAANHTTRELNNKLFNFGLKSELNLTELDGGLRPILSSSGGGGGGGGSTPNPTYTITLNGDNGTEAGGGDKVSGSNITITATPNNLYKFDSWTVVGPGEIASATSANTTFTVGAGDATITASYIIVSAPSLSGNFTDPDVSLTASEVNGTATYQFQRSTSPDFSSDLTTVQNTASNTLSDPLSSAGTYYYRVRSVNGSTQTAWSDTVTFTISFADVNDIADSTVGWYDASDSSTITHSSNVVTQWSDKSGNSLHLAPVAGETGPTTNSIQQNSLNVLDFNGDCLENGNFSHNISSAIYIAFLVELDSLFTDQYFLWAGTDNNNARCGIRKRSNQIVEIFGKTSSGTNTFVQFGAVTKGSFNILVAKIHGSNGAVYLNGSQIATGNSGAVNLNTFNLGHAEGEVQNFVGKFGEVVAFTDGNDLQKIEGYLAHKWGLESNLPTNHPYKSQAPLKSS